MIKKHSSRKLIEFWYKFPTIRLITLIKYLKVENGVVAYYSVHFPTVIVPGDKEKSDAVNDIFWDYMDNKLIKYWPTNQFDGTLIGPRNRRDYYVGMPSPFKESNVDETISYDR